MHKQVFFPNSPKKLSASNCLPKEVICIVHRRIYSAHTAETEVDIKNVRAY